MSSEGVAPTGGQYGFVRTGAFVEFGGFDGPFANLLIGQIYSASRLTTLMSIIMDQTIDHTNLTACQVCPRLRPYIYTLTDLQT